MSRRPRLSTTVFVAALALVGGISATSAADGAQTVVTTGAETAAGGYTSVTPARLLDTRKKIGVPGTSPVGAGRTITVQVTGQAGVPSTAANVSAVVINLTAVSPTTTSGYLTAYPYGHSRPTASSINWSKRGWIGANLVTVPLGTGGRINIFNSSGSTHIVADVMGYYLTGSAPTTPGTYGSYEFSELTRIVDTRLPGKLKGPLPRNSYFSIGVDFDTTGAAVNAHVTAFAVNITVTNTKGSGYLTAWDGDVSRIPGTSSLNFGSGQSVPNMAIVPVSQCTDCVTGRSVPQIGVVNRSSSTVDVVIDLVGVFDDNQPTGYNTYRFHPLASPQRIVDSRTAKGFSTLGRYQTKSAVVPNPSIAGANTAAIVANLTAVAPASPSVVTVWPVGTAKPTVSNLNPAAGQIVANMMIAELGLGANFYVNNYSFHSLNVLVDVAGTMEYYTSGATTLTQHQAALAPTGVAAGTAG
jgi:hypothetical protein